MKKDKKKLQDLVILFLQNNNKNIATVNKIKDYLVEKNVSLGRALNIIYQNTPTQLIEDEELCLLTKALYLTTQEGKINPEIWYHDEEIIKAETFYQHKKISNIMIIKNVNIENGMYATTGVPIKDIADWWNNGHLNYNLDTQRAAKKKLVDGQIIEMANINQDSVDKIAKKVETGKFKSNVITFNIRKTGTEVFKYNDKTNTLTIQSDNESTFVDVVDGYHRIGGFVKAIKNKPDLEFTTHLDVMHAEVKEVGEFIHQEAQHNDLDDETIEFYNPENENIELVKEINKDGSEKTNEMFNRIGRDLLEVEHSNKYTTYQTLSMAIKDNFTYEGAREGRLLKEFLIKGFNEIIGIYKDQFKNKSKDNYIAHNNAFIVYTTLLASVYSFPGWEGQLEKLLDRIDFKKTNPLWEQCSFKSSNVNKSLVKKISNIVKEMIK